MYQKCESGDIEHGKGLGRRSLRACEYKKRVKVEQYPLRPWQDRFTALTFQISKLRVAYSQLHTLIPHFLLMR